jgi:hypothetical protein
LVVIVGMSLRPFADWELNRSYKDRIADWKARNFPARKVETH